MKGIFKLEVLSMSCGNDAESPPLLVGSHGEPVSMVGAGRNAQRNGK